MAAFREASSGEEGKGEGEKQKATTETCKPKEGPPSLRTWQVGGFGSVRVFENAPEANSLNKLLALLSCRVRGAVWLVLSGVRVKECPFFPMGTWDGQGDT